MLQQILAILLVLALLAGTLFLLRRKGLAQFPAALPKVPGRTRQIQVLDRVALTPQHSLHLVEVRDEVFLIGVSPGGCNRITGSGELRAEAMPPC
jgi:flagellar biosynthetic protein FliO